MKFWHFIWNYKLTVWIQILKMQQCKLIILSNFYCIHSCCLNLFSCQICLFCMYILFIMHPYMYSSLYTCNCTVLYFSFFSENNNINVNVNVIFYQIFMIALQKLWKMFFISSKKLFSFLRYLSFSIFITHFSWYLNNEIRCNIETLTIDGVLNTEHFYGKIMQEMCTKS